MHVSNKTSMVLLLEVLPPLTVDFDEHFVSRKRRDTSQQLPRRLLHHPEPAKTLHHRVTVD